MILFSVNNLLGELHFVLGENSAYLDKLAS